MNSEGKNKETMNKHAYLLSSAKAGWSGIFTMLRTLCQIKSFSDPGSEPLLVRNYCARRTIGTKAWAANKIQIYPLCLPTRIISNDYIIYRAYTGSTELTENGEKAHVKSKSLFEYRSEMRSIELHCGKIVNANTNLRGSEQKGRANLSMAQRAKKSRKQYACDLCKITCDGKDTFNFHISGQRHKKRVLQLARVQRNCSTSVTSSTPLYYCEICQISCTSSLALMMHFKGGKHNKVLRYYKRKKQFSYSHIQSNDSSKNNTRSKHASTLAESANRTLNTDAVTESCTMATHFDKPVKLETDTQIHELKPYFQSDASKVDDGLPFIKVEHAERWLNSTLQSLAISPEVKAALQELVDHVMQKIALVIETFCKNTDRIFENGTGMLYNGMILPIGNFAKNMLQAGEMEANLVVFLPKNPTLEFLGETTKHIVKSLDSTTAKLNSMDDTLFIEQRRNGVCVRVKIYFLNLLLLEESPQEKENISIMVEKRDHLRKARDTWREVLRYIWFQNTCLAKQQLIDALLVVRRIFAAKNLEYNENMSFMIEVLGNRAYDSFAGEEVTPYCCFLRILQFIAMGWLMQVDSVIFDPVATPPFDLRECFTIHFRLIITQHMQECCNMLLTGKFHGLLGENPNTHL
ncbi:Zinc finger RNA-binding protein [Trichinella spiralis]|uniref:Zinc finger RNA-binding protein n=1 Tax=Trichinella spiralis TaxID=6334 RepID=A0A0V1BZV2_TRISP|nr:Zinc finger RNA-binding protein [Trichinella spiralis]